MRKSVKIIIWSVLGIAIIVSGFIYLSMFSSGKKSSKIILDALPNDAIVFFYGQAEQMNLNELFTHQAFENLKEMAPVNKLLTDYKKLDTLIQNPTNNNLLHQNMLLAVYQTAIGEFRTLAVFKVGKELHLEKVVPELSSLNKNKRIFENIEIVEYQNAQNELILSTAIYNNFLFVSKSSLLVEDGLRTLKNKTQQPRLVRLIGQNDLLNRWVFDFKQIYEISKVFVKPDAYGFFKKIGFDGYGVYRFTIAEDNITVRGNVVYNDSLPESFRIFEHQPDKTPDINKIISNKAVFAIDYNINNFGNAFNRLLEDKKRYKSLLDFEEKNGLSVKNELLPLIYGSYAVAVNEPIQDSINATAVLLLKVIETDPALQYFAAHSFSDSLQGESLSSYRDYPIIKTGLGNVFNIILQSPVNWSSHLYATAIRDYLLFSPSPVALSRYIEDYIAQQTLGTSVNFYRFSKSLSSRADFQFYINPVRALKIPQLVLEENYLKKFNAHKDAFKNYPAFAYQLSFDQSAIYNEIVFGYSPQKFRKSENLWDLALDTQLVTSPRVVVNHNDGSKEIIVFDARNQMYLISSSGKILWKKQLEASIVGSLQQIDFYNNKKLQYLFTTKSRLQMIDRLGRNVANYPIKLSTQTKTGMTAFDIRKNNKHQIYVSTVNHYTFGFNEAARPLNGWNPLQTSGNIIFPLKYFIKNGQVYFVATSDNGKFYLLTQKGNNVIPPVKLGTVLTNPMQIEFEPEFDKTHFISTDTAGRTCFIYLNGDVELRNYGSWSSAVKFDYQDVNNDNEKELIYLDHNALAVYSHEGQILFSSNLPVPFSRQAKFIRMGDNLYVAYINDDYKQLYLIDLNGEVYPNFPVDCDYGYEITDVDNDGEPEIIGVKNNKVFLNRF